MASSISRDMERAMAEAMNEIDKKMEKAFKNAMKRIEPKLLDVMRKASVVNYYRGYSPHVYIRTNQLHKAISLRLEDTSYGDMFAFSVFPKYDEKNPGMNHSKYKIVATYKHKKNKKFTGKVSQYICDVELKKKPDEEAIMEMTLGAGYHPKVGTADTEAPIWTEDDDGVLIDALQDYVNKNFEKLFNEEYDKL